MASSASDPPLSIGIVGAGGNTRSRHIPGFQEIPGVEITTVCNRSATSSRKVAEHFGIARVADTWQAVVACEQVDAVMIGTWPYLHAEVSIAALQAGKHVLTEARMARDLDEATRMVAAAEARPDRVAQIVPAPFDLEVHQTIRSLVDAGELGELREGIVTATGGGAADGHAPLSWRQSYERSGKNVMMLGILHETVLRWIGENPEWVIADGRVCTPRRLDPETGEAVDVLIPDSLTVLGGLGGGGRLVYHLSAVEAGRGELQIRLNGSKACLRYDLTTGTLYRTPIGGQESVVEIPPADRRGWRVEADFIDSIRNGTPVRLTSFPEGLRTMQFVEAVWESWQGGGRRISL